MEIGDQTFAQTSLAHIHKIRFRTIEGLHDGQIIQLTIYNLYNFHRLCFKLSVLFRVSYCRFIPVLYELILFGQTSENHGNHINL